MGCTNSKERPRTPPPDAALQNVVSDGDGFWAANGEQRASREATPLKAAADPFQTVDLTNPETAAAASTPAPAPAEDLAAAFGAPTAPALVPADAFGAPKAPILVAPAATSDAPRDSEDSARAATINRVPPGAAISPPPKPLSPTAAVLAALTAAPTLEQPTMPQPRVTAWIQGGGALTHATTTTDPRAGVTIKNAGGFSLAEAVAAPPTSPVAAIPEAFTAAFGAPPTPVVKQEAGSGETKADAAPKAPASVVAEAPSAAATTTEASAPKPSPTKKPSIKPVMPGGRKKSKNNKKKKKGSKK